MTEQTTEEFIPKRRRWFIATLFAVPFFFVMLAYWSNAKQLTLPFTLVLLALSGTAGIAFEIILWHALVKRLFSTGRPTERVPVSEDTKIKTPVDDSHEILHIDVSDFQFHELYQVAFNFLFGSSGRVLRVALLLTLLVFVPVNVAGALVLDLQPDTLIWLSVTVLLLAVPVFPLALAYLMNWARRGNKEKIIVSAKEGISTEIGGKPAVSLSWRRLSSVKEKALFFFVEEDGRDVLVIPKRFLPPSQLEALRGILQREMGRRYTQQG